MTNAFPQETKINEASSKPRDFLEAIRQTMPDEIRRTTAFQKLLKRNKNPPKWDHKIFNQTEQGSWRSKDRSREPQRNSGTFKARSVATQDNRTEPSSTAKTSQLLSKQSDELGYFHIEHISYKNYKYHKEFERSLTPDIPVRKPLLVRFQNRGETIEKAIQSLHIKKLYLREESSRSTTRIRTARKTESLLDFQNTLESVKLQQIENHNQFVSDNRRREVRGQSTHKRAQRKQHSGLQQTTSTQTFEKPFLIVANSQQPSIRDPEHFKKMFAIQFQHNFRDEDNESFDSGQKDKLIEQEFQHYSKLTQKFLEELEIQLQDQQLTTTYTNEEYRLSKPRCGSQLSFEILVIEFHRQWRCSQDSH